MTAGGGQPEERPAPEGQKRVAEPKYPATEPESIERDEKVLVLREQDRSFTAISRALGLGGGQEANAAFNRALRRRPAPEQKDLRAHEMARLDALGERVRKRADLDDVEIARRMHSLDRLRRALLSA